MSKNDDNGLRVIVRVVSISFWLDDRRLKPDDLLIGDGPGVNEATLETQVNNSTRMLRIDRIIDFFIIIQNLAVGCVITNAYVLNQFG